jgi:predicted nucleotidyltransferase
MSSEQQQVGVGRPATERSLSDADRRAIAEEGCIIRGLVGSTIHGLMLEGQDDRDEMAVAIEPPEAALGLVGFEHWVYRTRPEGVRSGPGDLDLTTYSLRKYARLAAAGNPTILLLLFVPREHLVVETPLGAQLQRLAPAFASTRAVVKFLGYMNNQRERLGGSRGQMRVNRPELIAAHGWDVKYGMHALRLAYQGLEYAQTGRLTLPMPEPARTRVFAVRRGEIPQADVLDEIASLEQETRQALEQSSLPGRPDSAAITRFLVDAYRDAWDRGQCARLGGIC